MRLDGQRRGEVDKELELWKKAYEMYPNNIYVVHQYMYALPHDENDLRISLAKKILSESTDEELRDGARQVIVFSLKNAGRIEEAKEYARTASDMWTCRDMLYTCCLTGEERIKAEQLLLIHMADNMQESAHSIAENSGDNGKKIAAYAFTIKLFDLLFSTGAHGFYNQRVCRAATLLSLAYLKEGRLDDCLCALRRAADSAIKFDSRGELNPRTSPLVDMIDDDRRGESKTYAETVTELTLRALSKPVFNPVRGTDEFRAIEDKLERAAGSRG